MDVVVREPAWAGDPVGYWLSNAVSRRVGRLSCMHPSTQEGMARLKLWRLLESLGGVRDSLL